MPDSTPTVVAPAVAAPEAAAPTVKSGWKTTEMYLVTLLLGGLVYGLHGLVEFLPSIASNPALPPWITPILSIAPIGLAWVMKLAVGEYNAHRKELKLAAISVDAQSAIAAGQAQLGLPPGGQLGKINE